MNSSPATFFKAREVIADQTTAEEDDDDDEPPPLEPDTPVTYPAIPLPPLSQPPPSTAMFKLIHMIPNLSTLRSSTSFIPSYHSSLLSRHPLSTANDPSKLILTSLEDASMWLISRLPIESEARIGGADALQLQLLEDLAALLAGDQLVPTFTEGEEVESKYKLASN